MIQGGDWVNYTAVGIALRHVLDSPTGSGDYVASSDMQNIELYGSA